VEKQIVGLAARVSSGAEMRQSGLDGRKQAHRTKAIGRKVHSHGKLRRRRRFAGSVAFAAVWKSTSSRKKTRAEIYFFPPALFLP
jgi:hypothetical protein